MDLVVTVPKWFWPEWIAEGDAAGEPESGEEWGFYLGGQKPQILPGERLYIVAHDRLRGYAPVTALKFFNGKWVICRKGGAVAVTIPDKIRGFQGFRRTWWQRESEIDFPEWKTEGVGKLDGLVAQRSEQATHNCQVVGSNPAEPTNPVSEPIQHTGGTIMLSVSQKQNPYDFSQDSDVETWINMVAEPHGYSMGRKLDPDYVKAMDLIMDGATDICETCNKMKPKGVACQCGGIK